MPQLCLAVASLALSTSRPVSVVLLANRLSLVLPYLLWYHTLLSSAVVSKHFFSSSMTFEGGAESLLSLTAPSFWKTEARALRQERVNDAADLSFRHSGDHREGRRRTGSYWC